jgi:acyl-coenzyme A synthetase/AMP-(fatty) acid ligase
MGIGADDLNYGIVAFSHSYGFSNLITPLLCRGVPLVAAQDALPRAVLAGLATTGATVLPAVPAVFHALGGLDGAMPGVRLCISAGAPLRVETARNFRQRFGMKVHTFYGASECGGIAYDASGDDVTEEGIVGDPLRHVTLEPQGGGEFLVRSAAAGLGYFPQAGPELAHGVFKPSDLLEKIPGGWKISGRRTDVINVGGKKVGPHEIERVLLAHGSVREAVVFGVEAHARTEEICACVVTDGAVDLAELRGHCARLLAPWQVPRRIIPLEEIPLTPRGKISRRELAQRFARAAS